MTAMANVSFTATYLKRPTATEHGKLGVRVLPQAAPSAGDVIRNVNIALVIDQSGSMEGDRITSVKRTIRLLIERLSNGDKISLVAFSSRATTLIRCETISDTTRRQVEDAVDRLVADGGTNMESGITELGSFVLQTGMPDAVVVLTDGHINEGISSIAGLSSVVGSYLQTTPIYTLGYGVDHNGDLLRALASRTMGTYTFIDTEIMLPASVGDLLGGLQGEVAKQAELAYPEEWKCEEPVDQQNPGIRNVGSLIADKPTWVMFTLPPGSADVPVVLTYKDGASEVRKELTADDSGLDAVE
ncbi:MAG: VWA domain-containing protein, partial [Actinobacteria bacterium]|nr:VWA domain-containing protein [Actinomycetota bacterium]